MRRFSTLFPFVIVLLWAQPVFAYLDPNSGSMMLQIILGGLAGLAVAGKLFWQRIMMFFTPRSKQESALDEEHSTEE